MIKGYLTFRNGLILFMIIGLFAFMVAVHENTHKEINRQYGCESTISYFPLPPKTISMCNLDTAHEISLKESQAMVEVVGYNVTPYLMLMVFFLFTIMYDTKQSGD